MLRRQIRVNLIISAQPKRLLVTQAMVEDLLWDPVFATFFLMGWEWDYWQEVALRKMWLIPRLEDHSGRSTAKTRRLFAYACLRCILLPGQQVLIFYQTAEVGRVEFWNYFKQVENELFHAQIGGFDEQGEEKKKSITHGSAAYIAEFRNGSRLIMPAGGFISQGGVTHASRRSHTLILDEYPKIDAFGVAIDSQLTAINSMEEWSQQHPIFSNHVKFFGSAEDRRHPAYARHRDFDRQANGVIQGGKRVGGGDPHYGTLCYSYKNYSAKLKPNGRTYAQAHGQGKWIDDLKRKLSPAAFQQQVLGIWSQSGKAWYDSAALDRAVQLGRERKLLPLTRREDAKTPEHSTFNIQHSTLNQPKNVFYFLGGDPAPSLGEQSDDGGLAVLRGTQQTEEPGENLCDWRLDYVWARRIRGWSASTWSAYIHLKHQHFGFSKICLDWNGGGNYIMGELLKTKQDLTGAITHVRPIARPEERSVLDASYVLTMYSRNDGGIQSLWPDLPGDDNLNQAMHTSFQEGLMQQMFAFPAPFSERPPEETAHWPEELVWANRCLSGPAGEGGSAVVRDQLENIFVNTTTDGTWITTRHGALTFDSRGKKDLAYSAILAYVGFLVWLKNWEFDLETETGDGGVYLFGQH